MHKQKISLILESGFSNIEWVINKESQKSSSVNHGLVFSESATMLWQTFPNEVPLPLVWLSTTVESP